MPILAFFFWVLPGISSLLFLYSAYGAAFSNWCARKHITISGWMKLISVLILIWVCATIGPLSWVGVWLITCGIKVPDPSR